MVGELFVGLLAFGRFLARPMLPERSCFGTGLRYACSQPLLTLLLLIVLVVKASLAPLEMLLPAWMLALGAGAQGFGLFFSALTGGLAAGGLAPAPVADRVSVAVIFASAGLACALVWAGPCAAIQSPSRPPRWLRPPDLRSTPPTRNGAVT